MFQGAVVVVGTQRDDEPQRGGWIFERNAQPLEEVVSVLTGRRGEDLLELIDDKGDPLPIGAQAATNAPQDPAATTAKLLDE